MNVGSAGTSASVTSTAFAQLAFGNREATLAPHGLAFGSRSRSARLRSLRSSGTLGQSSRGARTTEDAGLCPVSAS